MNDNDLEVPNRCSHRIVLYAGRVAWKSRGQNFDISVLIRMHRNHNTQFRPKPEFAGTKKKNPGGNEIFLEAMNFL